MAKYTLELPEELDREFRKEIFRRYGYKRGSIKRAFMEAIKLWMKEGEKEVK